MTQKCLIQDLFWHSNLTKLDQISLFSPVNYVPNITFFPNLDLLKLHKQFHFQQNSYHREKSRAKEVFYSSINGHKVFLAQRQAKITHIDSTILAKETNAEVKSFFTAAWNRWGYHFVILTFIIEGYCQLYEIVFLIWLTI